MRNKHKFIQRGHQLMIHLTVINGVTYKIKTRQLGFSLFWGVIFIPLLYDQKIFYGPGGRTFIRRPFLTPKCILRYWVDVI